MGYGINVAEDVVNLSDVKHGAEDFAVDLGASFRGEAKWLGDRNYKVQLNIRNAFDKDENVPGIKDINGSNIRVIRKSGRQFILSFEVDV